MDADVAELVRQGDAALRAGDGATARSLFEAAVEVEDAPEALYGLGHALYLGCKYTAAVVSWEGAYRGFRSQQHNARAALVASWLAYVHGCVYGNFAVAGGWTGRAASMVEGADHCPERGWVELTLALFAEDPDERERRVAEATSIAKRVGDLDLELDALSYVGWCLLERGRIEEGMARLDEAVAAATGGGVRSFTAAGDIYCKSSSPAS